VKALTVKQPWAWAIFNGKNIENRTQLWSYRGPLAIHAGMRWSERGLYSPLVLDAFGGSPLDSRDRFTTLQSDMKRGMCIGAILGTVELVEVHHDAGCCQPWGEHGEVETARSRTNRERYGTSDTAHRTITHLVLENPRPLAEPIPCKGALGLWAPPADANAALEEL
jgi:hypothetical protein